MLLSALTVLTFATPVISGDEDPPRGLTVVVVEVGQGDASLILSPDRTLHVIDGGPDGEGLRALIPAIQRLNPARYGFVFLTHFHSDHSGGLDEVLQRFPFQLAYDRGDLNRPNDGHTNRYLAAAGNRRRTIQVGQVLQLGGGATLRVICANGVVVGGTTVSLVGRQQQESGRSIAMRLAYANFSMWFGGDLTGGGNGTADVESPASLQCGDVDVYHVDHHGSNTSSQPNLVNRIAPELCVVSAGSSNPFGHPTFSTINRLNQAAAARLLLSTTRGAGAVGFGVAGSITIATDGLRYRATAANGQFLDFFVDEVTDRDAIVGDLVVSEFHRNPARVSDAYGEYIELTNVGAAPVSLRNLRISTTGGTFSIRSNLAAIPGRPILLLPDGDPARNGGLPLGFVWPFRAISLADSRDSIVVRNLSATLDTVVYDPSFAGGAGVATERRDLLASPTAANFAAATTPFGRGDLGSPARRNRADAGCHPARLRVDASPGELLFRAAALSHGGRFSVVGMSFQNGPGFPLLGNHIPIEFDLLFDLVLQLPGFGRLMPFEGYRSFALPLPSPNPLAGRTAYAVHIIVDFASNSIPKVSSVETVQFQ